MIELGCWPGAWLQVLAPRVGLTGAVLGVDIVPVDELPAPVALLQLDFTEEAAPEQIASALGRPADLLVSDAAPKLTGIRDVDQAAMAELYQGALAVADRAAAPTAPLVIKGFPGPESDAFRAELRRRFASVSEVRPEGKRGTSKEFYWVAQPQAPRAKPSRSRRKRRGR